MRRNLEYSILKLPLFQRSMNSAAVWDVAIRPDIQMLVSTTALTCTPALAHFFDRFLNIGLYFCRGELSSLAANRFERPLKSSLPIFIREYL